MNDEFENMFTRGDFKRIFNNIYSNQLQAGQ